MLLFTSSYASFVILVHIEEEHKTAQKTKRNLGLTVCLKLGAHSERAGHKDPALSAHTLCAKCAAMYFMLTHSVFHGGGN